MCFDLFHGIFYEFYHKNISRNKENALMIKNDRSKGPRQAPKLALLCYVWCQPKYIIIMLNERHHFTSREVHQMRTHYGRHLLVYNHGTRLSQCPLITNQALKKAGSKVQQRNNFRPIYGFPDGDVMPARVAAGVREGTAAGATDRLEERSPLCILLLYTNRESCTKKNLTDM